MCCFLGLKKKVKKKPNQLAYSIILRKITGRLELLGPLEFDLKWGSVGEANYHILCNTRIQPVLLVDSRGTGRLRDLVFPLRLWRVMGSTLFFKCDFLAHPFWSVPIQSSVFTTPASFFFALLLKIHSVGFLFQRTSICPDSLDFCWFRFVDFQNFQWNCRLLKGILSLQTT